MNIKMYRVVQSWLVCVLIGYAGNVSAMNNNSYDPLQNPEISYAIAHDVCQRTAGHISALQNALYQLVEYLQGAHMQGQYDENKVQAQIDLVVQHISQWQMYIRQGLSRCSQQGQSDPILLEMSAILTYAYQEIQLIKEDLKQPSADTYLQAYAKGKAVDEMLNNLFNILDGQKYQVPGNSSVPKMQDLVQESPGDTLPTFIRSGAMNYNIEQDGIYINHERTMAQACEDNFEVIATVRDQSYARLLIAHALRQRYIPFILADVSRRICGDNRSAEQEDQGQSPEEQLIQKMLNIFALPGEIANHPSIEQLTSEAIAFLFDPKTTPETIQQGEDLYRNAHAENASSIARGAWHTVRYFRPELDRLVEPLQKEQPVSEVKHAFWQILQEHGFFEAREDVVRLVRTHPALIDALLNKGRQLCARKAAQWHPVAEQLRGMNSMLVRQRRGGLDAKSPLAHCFAHWGGMWKRLVPERVVERQLAGLNAIDDEIYQDAVENLVDGDAVDNQSDDMRYSIFNRYVGHINPRECSIGEVDSLIGSNNASLGIDSFRRELARARQNNEFSHISLKTREVFGAGVGSPLALRSNGAGPA